MESFCSFRQKEVINIKDGYRFGYIIDLEFEVRSGKITRLVLPANNGLFSFFGRDKVYKIPWCAICKIGEDVILVDVCLDDVLTSIC
ncbi:MAG: YlmC/YmxH family sporulation protein [Lachnospiraceae bacterium]|nr:YlmC/YmxH family sporulation protein [Lachnospiraceae bacterium]